MDRIEPTPWMERSLLRAARKATEWPLALRRLWKGVVVVVVAQALWDVWSLRSTDSLAVPYAALAALLLAVVAVLMHRLDSSLLLLVKLGALERPPGEPGARPAPAAREAVSRGAALPLGGADARRLDLARRYAGRLGPLRLLYAGIAVLPVASVALSLALLELPRPLELAVVASGALASGAALSALRIPGWMRLAVDLERRSAGG